MVRSGALYAEARAGLCPPTARGVTRALGPPGWPRRGRWRPGLPRLYPNALYRARAHPARALGAPLRPMFGGAAAGAHFRARGDENFNVGIGADDGANVAAIENRSRWGRGKL